MASCQTRTLPVPFWIHGGGFELGSPQPYNASVLVPRAVTQDKPCIFVTVYYRLGGFGFLGSELLADRSTNLRYSCVRQEKDAAHELGLFLMFRGRLK